MIEKRLNIASKYSWPPRPAQYLLRVDDLCPTVDAEKWRSLAALIAEFDIDPLLAIVPDNRDPDLIQSKPDPAFWDQMRAMAARGATIGLHGYRHLCQSRNGGILVLAPYTEFAGVPEEMQRHWIAHGLDILRAQGLNPAVWVAPRHGFDAATLRALRSCGIGAISDGFARLPHTRDGLLFIPQQLWAGIRKNSGLWTICLHPNTMSDDDLAALRGFLRQHAARFTSFERVAAEFRGTTLSPVERLRAAATWLRQLAKKLFEF